MIINMKKVTVLFKNQFVDFTTIVWIKLDLI